MPIPSKEFIDVIIQGAKVYQKEQEELRDRAIAILLQIVSNPAYIDNFLNDKCLYCYEWQHKSHKPDCPYLLAKQLLKEFNYV